MLIFMLFFEGNFIFFSPDTWIVKIFQVFDETSKSSKNRPNRLETFIQVEIRAEIQGFSEKTSRQKKIPF